MTGSEPDRNRVASPIALGECRNVVQPDQGRRSPPMAHTRAHPSYSTMIASTSNNDPFGSAETSTVARAG